MTKGTKIFRSIISVLLALTILFVAFITMLFFYFGTTFVHTRGYGIFVAGVEVTRENMNDVLGDDTVWYTPSSNILHFENANIECSDTAIYSSVDLQVELIGENKFVCKDKDVFTAIYASDFELAKDLVFTGEGSLTIDYQNVNSSAMAIFARDLSVLADITINTPSCTEMSYGIVCTSSLRVEDNTDINVNVGSAKHTVGINIRGNAIIHEGSVIDIACAPGTAETGRGFAVDGDLILRNGATVNVSIDDEGVALSECIRANGVIDANPNARINASSKKAPAIECLGSARLSEGVGNITANTANAAVDFICYGAIVSYGATLNGEVEALGGIHNKE